MAAPHRIAILIDNLNGGGAERVASHLATGWAAQGKVVEMITITPASNQDYRLGPKVRRHELRQQGRTPGLFGGLRSNYRRIQSIRRILTDADTEVLIAFVVPMNILAIFAGAGLSCRVIVSERNDPKLQSFGHLWNIARRLLYRFADKVTANSHGAVQSLHSYCPAEKLAYVPNPVKIPQHAGRKIISSSIFLAVGRLVDQKAYDIILHGLKIAHADLENWKLIVLGDGPLMDDLKRLAASLKIDSHIEWQGRVNDPFPFYESARLLLMPSRFEGTPNALLEAMSFGLTPIVSNASPGPLEIVRDGISGLVVPVNDPQSLANAIVRLSHDENLCTTLAEGAIKSVAHLQYDNALNEWMRVISREQTS